MTTPEIEELKRLIEERYGKQLCTTTDFEEFTLTLKKCGIAVSASTMKRLYDYVGDSHKPRVATLDQLSVYIGHKSFAHFVKWLKNSTRYNSSFFNARQLISDTLSEGDKVEIGWAPNRQLFLTYLGHSTYRVEQDAGRRQVYYWLLYNWSASFPTVSLAQQRAHRTFRGRTQRRTDGGESKREK